MGVASARALHPDVVARADARIGRSIRGRYVLERRIGIGGAAAVYSARIPAGGRVAVKVLHPEIGAIADLRRRFVRESSIANGIDHPGVVRVLDAGEEEEDGTAFLAMELLEGRTLEDEWQEAGRRLRLDRAVAIGLAVLDVLAAAHRARVVHRDVKPENLFLTTAGAPLVRVLDFGIARLLDHPRTTPTGDAFGTAEFIAPEQARGRSRDVDARTDLYAVGAILFALVAGRYVHETDNPMERLVLAATRPAPAVRSVVPDLDEDLAHVIDLALSPRREHRWASAEAMHAALAAACR